MNEIQRARLRKILDLQHLMQQQARANGEPEGADHLCPVAHHFAPGLYAREMLIPAGVTVVGKMHRHDHLATVARGRILIVSDEGETELVAPCTFTSRAGVKRAAHALEDTVFITYHPTPHTDVAMIEADVIVPEVEVLERAGMEAIQ